MTDEQVRFDWHFWRQWLMFSTLGYGLGGFLGWTLAVYMNISGRWVAEFLYDVPGIFFYAAGGAIAGTLIGVTQWRAIRLKSPETNRFIWLTGNIIGMMVGWGLFFEVLFRTYDYESFILPLLAGGITWGLISGMTQWYALKERLHRVSIFMILSILIGIFALGIGFAWVPPVVFGYMSNSGSDMYGFMYLSTMVSLFLWPLAGLLGGMASGYLLVWIIQSPKMKRDVVV